MASKTEHCLNWTWRKTLGSHNERMVKTDKENPNQCFWHHNPLTREGFVLYAWTDIPSKQLKFSGQALKKVCFE